MGPASLAEKLSHLIEEYWCVRVDPSPPVRSLAQKLTKEPISAELLAEGIDASVLEPLFVRFADFFWPESVRGILKAKEETWILLEEFEKRSGDLEDDEWEQFRLVYSLYVSLMERLAKRGQAWRVLGLVPQKKDSPLLYTVVQWGGQLSEKGRKLRRPAAHELMRLLFPQVGDHWRKFVAEEKQPESKGFPASPEGRSEQERRFGQKMTFFGYLVIGLEGHHLRVMREDPDRLEATLVDALRKGCEGHVGAETLVRYERSLRRLLEGAVAQRRESGGRSGGHPPVQRLGRALETIEAWSMGEVEWPWLRSIQARAERLPEHREKELQDEGGCTDEEQEVHVEDRSDPSTPDFVLRSVRHFQLAMWGRHHTWDKRYLEPWVVKRLLTAFGEQIVEEKKKVERKRQDYDPKAWPDLFKLVTVDLLLRMVLLTGISPEAWCAVRRIAPALEQTAREGVAVKFWLQFRGIWWLVKKDPFRDNKRDQPEERYVPTENWVRIPLGCYGPGVSLLLEYQRWQKDALEGDLDSMPLIFRWPEEGRLRELQNFDVDRFIQGWIEARRWSLPTAELTVERLSKCFFPWFVQECGLDPIAAQYISVTGKVPWDFRAPLYYRCLSQTELVTQFSRYADWLDQELPVAYQEGD